MSNMLSEYQHQGRRISSVRIIPFIGYGSSREAFISGMVVAKNGLSKPIEGQTRWQNIKAMVKRYLSNEIENARVAVTFNGMKHIVTTDKYGIFRCHFRFQSGMRMEGIWNKALICYLPSRVIGSNPEDFTEQAEGDVLIVQNTPEFGVISDIDDTILVSYATQKLQKLMLMLLNNAYTRMPFEGVAAFYHALQKGKNGHDYNPVFYVSNSEWHLYDLLFEFIEFNRIPKGPLLLREMALYLWRPWKIREVSRNHKKEVIRKLFNLYNHTKFILIGDSGQKDAEIYSEIVTEFPGRVLSIYIRDIGITQNLTKIGFILKRLHEEYNTEMILVKDSEAAAKHAIEKGYISGEGMRDIILQKDRDKLTGTNEKLI